MNDAALQRLLHDAAQAERDGRFDDAVALSRQAADAHSPLALDALLRLGRLLVPRRRTDEAAAVLADARARADKDNAGRKAAVAVNLAALNERRRDPDLALRLLTGQEPILHKG